MKLYGLKTCDTCRKALKVLSNAEFVDVRAEGVPGPVLEAAHTAFGERILNTRSTTWRNLDEEDRAKAPLELLQLHPTLMKRPLIDVDGTLYLGWGKDVQAALG
ncbi:putative reductase [Tritonibacter multivorans]|uniref:Putative reductase n=1 Tax=Tritonibacter multivorans TaxID=928856 RepID=A0A0P1GHI8_9RHOB|nr:ArsC/Spx/MgsR family protein [Tritonibacter multivorans]MDA7420661.1 arsenate reductase [Tritonibacter multivorans]CUH81178.1 putative reductase [Tritonibacter multivorans]SFC30122.1 arsenate reductase [Tritonibacter multivorans]